MEQQSQETPQMVMVQITIEQIGSYQESGSGVTVAILYEFTVRLVNNARRMLVGTFWMNPDIVVTDARFVSVPNTMLQTFADEPAPISPSPEFPPLTGPVTHFMLEEDETEESRVVIDVLAMEEDYPPPFVLAQAQGPSPSCASTKQGGKCAAPSQRGSPYTPYARRRRATSKKSSAPPSHKPAPGQQ